ncbi:MAG TPA: hypothetical protein VFB31_07825 [Pseudolabrys sp.]|nr:hypothetical protein [Pseudolabrys sp.]
MARLTRTQRKLHSEVEEIAAAVRMDVWNIERYSEPPFSRTALLKIMKDKLVRSHVIIKYALIDEYLTDVICNYYFYRQARKNTTYRELWRTKRFEIFVHHLMDEMFLLKKLSVVDAIKGVPSEVSSAIQRINDIRNALAHSLFPENRRRYMAYKKVIYSGKDLFTVEGVNKFNEDCALAERWLQKKL